MPAAPYFIPDELRRAEEEKPHFVAATAQEHLGCLKDATRCLQTAGS